LRRRKEKRKLTKVRRNLPFLREQKMWFNFEKHTWRLCNTMTNTVIAALKREKKAEQSAPQSTISAIAENVFYFEKKTPGDSTTSFQISKRCLQ